MSGSTDSKTGERDAAKEEELVFEPVMRRASFQTSGSHGARGSSGSRQAWAPGLSLNVFGAQGWHGAPGDSVAGSCCTAHTQAAALADPSRSVVWPEPHGVHALTPPLAAYAPSGQSYTVQVDVSFAALRLVPRGGPRKVPGMATHAVAPGLGV